uniref:Uncharacterized protein n=1 Tax=Stegastes partitus TaxID=144197 RepID=A0A3B4ZXV5_9TELE
MTMYSGDFGNVEVQGNIQFSINYIQRLREFHIFVAECRVFDFQLAGSHMLHRVAPSGHKKSSC